MPDVDRMWVVTEQDRWAARWIAGARNVDVIPNGVDVEHFAPRSVAEQPDTAVFWGRLDFGPNVQALEWLVRQVWPRVRDLRPGAALRIIGFKPGDEGTRRVVATGPAGSARRSVPECGGYRADGFGPWDQEQVA
jgi:glycosyltransferase involved in cell wall biosynthesis